jgi:hypothetical protein
MSYTIRLQQREDWPDKKYAVKWFAGGKCQVCGWKPPTFAWLDTHHNDRTRQSRREELPTDFACLCSNCHAFYEYVKRHGREIRLWLLNEKKRADLIRVRLEEIEEWLSSHHARPLRELLDRAQAELDMLLGMTEEAKLYGEWQDRRAA